MRTPSALTEDSLICSDRSSLTGSPNHSKSHTNSPTTSHKQQQHSLDNTNFTIHSDVSQICYKFVNYYHLIAISMSNYSHFQSFRVARFLGQRTKSRNEEQLAPRYNYISTGIPTRVVGTCFCGEILEAPATYRSASVSKSSHL